MNGQGHYWIGRAWFRLYWFAFALILLVLAYGLWRRGTETRFLPRLGRLPRRLARLCRRADGCWRCSSRPAPGRSSLQHRHSQRVPHQRRRRSLAATTRRTLYEYHTPQSRKITDVALNVAIYPHEPRIVTTGGYRWSNSTDKPMTVLHVRLPRDLQADAHRAARMAAALRPLPLPHLRLRQADAARRDARRCASRSVWEQQGFKNSGNLTRIVDNGTFVNDRKICAQHRHGPVRPAARPVKRRASTCPATCGCRSWTIRPPDEGRSATPTG